MKKYIAIITLCALGFLMGCKEEEHIKITGDIIGFVKLFDEKGVELEDKGNVTVSLDQNTSATTDKSGRFEFLNVSPGTFKVEFKKEGFGTTKRYNFVFVGGNKPGVISNINMIALPQVQVTSKSISVLGNEVTISGTMTEVDKYYFMYYLSDKPEVSNENYLSSWGTSFCCVNVSQFQHRVIINPLTSPLYLVGYALSSGTMNGGFGYYDYENGTNVITGGKKLFEAVKIK